jgi:CheY-like chemotaxis protein
MRRPLHILLIEDNDEAARITKKLLTMTDGRMTVERVDNLAHAVERIKHGGIDAVLTDLRLPDADGDEAVRVLLGVQSSLPVVAFTGWDADVEDHLFAAGAQDFFQKPVAPEILTSALRKAVARKEAERKYTAVVEGMAATDQVIHAAEVIRDSATEEAKKSDSWRKKQPNAGAGP